jgi:hypothetical protein
MATIGKAHQPQYIEDSPYVVLRVGDYIDLLEGFDDPLAACRNKPQVLKDAGGTATHVVLMNTYFQEVLENQIDSEFLFYIKMPKKQIVAKGLPCWPEDAMTVLSGSSVGDAVSSLQPQYRSLRQMLIDNNVVGTVDGQLVFCTSWTFDNPSTAARIVTGDSVNGNNWWKDRHNVALKDRGMGARR